MNHREIKRVILESGRLREIAYAGRLQHFRPYFIINETCEIPIRNQTTKILANIIL